MSRIKSGIERSRSPSRSESDEEDEKPFEPLSLTRTRRTVAQHTSSAWATLLPSKKGGGDDEDETHEEEKVERKRFPSSQGSASRRGRARKTASPASRKDDFEKPVSINVEIPRHVEVVVPRVNSPKSAAGNRMATYNIKPKVENVMDNDQLESIEKEVEKHRNEAEKVASASESALEESESPKQNGKALENIIDSIGGSEKPREKLTTPSGRGRGRGRGGGGTPGRGRGRGRGIALPALPSMGGPRPIMPNRGGSMAGPRMGSFQQFGGQPPVMRAMENGEGRAPMKILRLRAGGPSLSTTNPQTGSLPSKPIASSSMPTSSAIPSGFAKEIEELSAKLTNKSVSGSTVNELTITMTQLQQELDRVKEDRSRVIANNREFVDQMQLSHATAIDIKDSRIRQLESQVDKLQSNYDFALRRIELLLLKHEVGETTGTSGNVESAPKTSIQPQRVNIKEILESKQSSTVIAKSIPQKHPASTSSYSSMDEPAPKIARNFPQIRIQGVQKMMQLSDSRLAALERKELGDESLSDSEARELEDEEDLDEEESMYKMDAIMETQRQLFESGLP